MASNWMHRAAALAVLFALMHQAFSQVHIVLDAIPANTPENDPIHIAGNFQGWNPSDANFQLSFDSSQLIHEITLDSGLGALEFKFTRGSWNTVEGDANGDYIPNRTYPSSDGDTLHLSILGWEDLGSGGSGGGSGTASPNVSVLDEDFFIPQLNRGRRVWIYLPPDYDSSEDSYPVLYMHDGQNVFDASTSLAGEWEVDETLDQLHSSESDPGIIVVAIDNGESHRIDEYGPWINPSYGGGEGEAYCAFLAETLKPYIDQNYRTKTDANSTGIMGSSLGGLISIYAAARYPQVFGRVAAFSPAYWFNPEIFEFLYSEGVSSETRVYQIGGSNEGANMAINMELMEDTILASGYTANNILSTEHSDGQHSEWYWAREFKGAYTWLFRQEASAVRESMNHHLTDIKLYPNPTSDQVSLAFSLREEDEITLYVSDTVNGGRKELLNEHFTQGKHTISLQLDNSGLSSGHYMLVLKSGKGEQVIPFQWLK